MNKLFLLLALGLTGSLTAFSQFSNVIIPDKKVDSFYCFGVQKTNQLVKQAVELESKDKQLASCEGELWDWEQANASKDSALLEKERELSAWSFKESLWQQERQSFNKTIDLQAGELKKEKRKGLWTTLGTTGGLILNALLTTVLLIRR